MAAAAFIAGAQFLKSVYDDYQRKKAANAYDAAASRGGGGGYSAGVDFSKYENDTDYGGGQVTPEAAPAPVPQQMAIPPMQPAPSYQPQIGGNIDERLKQLRLLEASRGFNQMPQQPTLAPQGYGPIGGMR